MPPNRREFLQASAAAAGALSVGLPRDAFAVAAVPTTVRPMRILILGGTGFIGPHMVRYALYRGHTVSIFNRGRSKPDLFPGVETLIGDRDAQLDSLRGKSWDACIDNTGYVPRHVRDSANLLKGSVGRYLFTSTGSVYQADRDAIDEDSPLLEAEDPTSEDVSKYYGPLKVLCEQAVNDIYGPQATIVRPHIVAGPGDSTDRYTYWPARIDRGGEIIAPGDQDNPVQYVDVRDLSEFCIHLVERDVAGTFNGAGPMLQEVPMAQFLYGIRAVTTADVRFTWLDEAFLAKHGIGGFGYPLWISQNGNFRGACRVSMQRSVAHGMTFRPLAVTARDTLEWYKAQPKERRDRVKLNLDRDAKILEAWHARAG